MIIPLLLKQKSKAIIIAPSGKVPASGIEEAVEVLKKWGLVVCLGKHLSESNGVFAGTDAQRLADFQEAIDDPTVSLILCARGGYGLTRILDNLLFDRFYKHPKWVVGFSDITAFHLAAVKQDILTIHGPVGTSFSRLGAEDSIDELHNILFSFQSIIRIESHQIRIGSSEGVLVGGNLSIICESLGTKTEINTMNKILVLEDVGDYYYRIDRMLNQLARAGKFENLKGLVIGQFTNMLDGENKFIESVKEMIVRLTADYDYPIADSMAIGHEPQNHPFIHGAVYKLNVESESAQLELQTKL